MALSIVAKTLEEFDDDNLIPCYGFGDVTTTEEAVFSFNVDNKPSRGLQSLVKRYLEIADVVKLSGPTSFAPLIRQAIADVYNSGMRFHVLLILADGQVSGSCYKDTINAVVDACNVPMSIIMVGVGDGPWEAMRQFDDDIPQRSWDNFQFVQFDKLFKYPPKASEENRQANFALHALMEIPEQYKLCERLIGDTSHFNPKYIEYVKNKGILRQPPDITRLAEAFKPPNVVPETTPDDYARFFQQGT
eukprot:g1403.t1